MMQAKHTMAALAVTSMALAGTGYAQTTSGTPTYPAPPASGAPGTASTTQQEPSQMLASTLIGMQVKNGTDDKAEHIGKITDLVLNQEQKTVNVLIGVGGFLGIGAKDVGVPLDKVEFNPQTKTAIVHMSKEELEKAPAYVTLAQKQAQQKHAEEQSQMKQQQTQPPSSPLGAPPPVGGSAKQ